MSAPDHALRAHARLSASSSDRWLNCTAAPTMESAFADERSSFAQEGTDAHELCERALRAGRNADEMVGPWPTEMRDYVQMYLDYVRAIEGELLVEQRFDLGTWIPEGFGTSDAVVLGDNVLHVVDFKYGKGVRVDAEHNTQLMLYALGAVDEYDLLQGPFASVTLHIHQPRIGHVDSWTIATAELLAWGESIKPIARIAFDGPGEAKAGDHCTFCRARHTCRARAEINLAIARDEMGEYCPPAATLSDDDLAAIYPQLDGLVRWANDLQAYCLAQATAGKRYAGLKLVEGVSRRVIKPESEDAVIAALREHGLDDYEFLSTKLTGITAIEKLLGKKDFTALLGEHIAKPPGKPVLVAATDKRKEYDLSHIQTAITEMTAYTDD